MVWIGVEIEEEVGWEEFGVPCSDDDLGSGEDGGDAGEGLDVVELGSTLSKGFT